MVNLSLKNANEEAHWVKFKSLFRSLTACLSVCVFLMALRGLRGKQQVQLQIFTICKDAIKPISWTSKLLYKWWIRVCVCEQQVYHECGYERIEHIKKSQPQQKKVYTFI